MRLINRIAALVSYLVDCTEKSFAVIVYDPGSDWLRMKTLFSTLAQKHAVDYRNKNYAWGLCITTRLKTFTSIKAKFFCRSAGCIVICSKLNKMERELALYQKLATGGYLIDVNQSCEVPKDWLHIESYSPEAIHKIVAKFGITINGHDYEKIKSIDIYKRTYKATEKTDNASQSDIYSSGL